jgi:eukaryotic-like serine/threonine-protein kinase
MQQLINFFRSRTFFAQFAMVFIFVFLILFFTYRWLSSYTNHGETVTVPDLRGMKFKELSALLAKKSLNVQIADSSVFLLDKPPGVVIEQDPDPNERVKENRTIYVTITRTVPPGVKLPNLVDVSKRQAEAILASYGLQIGNSIYKPDLAKDAVLGMMHNGQTVNPGDQLSKGSVIDLVLGDGIGNTEVTVPPLVGLTLDEALFVLKGSQLNAGSTLFDAGVRDSAIAKVYRQFPEPGDSSVVKQGEAIDLYLK